MNQQALLDKICESDRLPMLPDVAVKIIELSNDEDLYPDKVSSVIANDPMLTAKLLSIANSALFGFQRKISNLNEALAILGIELTMSMAVGFALIDMLDEKQKEPSEFNYEFFWRKSVLSAVAAIEMKPELPDVKQGDIYIAALMQDVGIVALERIIGKKYVAMSNRALSHIDLIELERRSFGMDHADVGAALIQKWGLPETLCRAVKNSHSLLEGKPFSMLSDLEYGVAFSGLLAEQWIAESSHYEFLDRKVKSAIARLTEEGYNRTVQNSMEAVPETSEIFNIQLLSPDQSINVA